MKLVICETDPEALAAYRTQFARHPVVEFADRALLDAPAEAIVLPANSFGFMDGGLALKISERFGFAFEDTVREAIQRRYAGEVLVGQAEVFPTGGWPAHVVYTPIHRTPQGLSGTINAYLAARGAFAAVRRFIEGGGGPIETIAFPDLGAEAAKPHPLIAARQLRYAFEEAIGLRKAGHQNLSRIARREKKLKEMPGAAGEAEE